MTQASPLPLTKIVATLGPASANEETITKLIAAGVSVFRLNFSHGTLDEHGAWLRLVREVCSRGDRPVAVLGDLPGPRIRVGKVVEEGIDLHPGSLLIFQREPIVARPDARGQHRLSSNYPRLLDDARPGERLLIADGTVRTLVIDAGDELICRVTHGGRVTSGKGINLPETELTLETITDRDWECVAWAAEHHVDYLALSFVRSAADVQELSSGIRRRIGPGLTAPPELPVIAKIETPAALLAIDSIITAADGIMVARGDLGVEMDLAEVPVLQKRLVAAAQEHGKPCIVATQMLESMIESSAPTRAEANDVAGAIFDKTDAVMLSGETAIGRYPVVTVEHMRRIAEHTEAHLASLPPVSSPPERLRVERSPLAALAHGVWTVAHDVDAKLIVVWSQTGGGARFLSQNVFRIPIIAVTSDATMARRMQLYRGVRPLCIDTPPNLAAFDDFIDDYVQEQEWAGPGDALVIVAGEPLGTAGVTNSLAIHVVGEPGSGYRGHQGS
ncbi:MAG: pyruvate kinase [Planctomycetes bacterium]|nr:pyruvate kinase [Planctomycetota bacterium]